MTDTLIAAAPWLGPMLLDMAIPCVFVGGLLAGWAAGELAR